VSEPTSERFVTDLHVYDWPDAQVQLSGFKRGSESFSALVTVVDTNERLINFETVNLLAGRTRASFAKSLATGATNATEWEDRLKYVAYTSLTEWAEGSSQLVVLTDIIVDYSIAPMLLPPLVPASGVVVMYGDGSAGKSMFILAILLTICTGHPFLGVKPERIGPVIYFDWEDSAQTIRERAEALCKAAGVELPATFHYREMDRPVSAGEERIRREVEETKAVCAAFDSMGMMLGGDPSDPVLVIPAVNVMKRIGIPAIGIHHLSAEAAKSTDLRDKQKGYGCHSADTEILTRSGWKRHGEYVEGEEILTYDSSSERYVWDVPSEVHVYPYRGEMHLYAKRSMNLLVTPNHRMLVRPVHGNRTGRPSKWSQDWQFVESQNLNATPIRVPYMAEWPDEGEPVETIAGLPANPVIALTGYFASEGSWHKGAAPVITQGDGPVADAIAEAFAAAGVPFHRTVVIPTREKDHATINHFRALLRSGAGRALQGWLRKCGGHSWEKRIPIDDALTWSKDQRLALLSALMDGDGHWWGLHGAYATTSVGLADDVQRLALSVGYAASVRTEPANENRQRYTVDIHRRFRSSLFMIPSAKNSRQVVEYNGFVYCFTVASGAYVTRREGKIAVSGNSVYVRNGARSQFFIDRFQEEEADEGFIYAFHTKVNRGKKSKPLAWHISYENDAQGFLRGLTYTPKSASDYIDRLKKQQPPGEMSVMDAIRAFLVRRTSAGTALYPVEEITIGVNEIRGKEVSEQVVINKLNEGKRLGEFVNFPSQANPRKRVWAVASQREEF